MAGLCEGGNEPSGSLKAISDEPREFNLPTLPQRCITYEAEKLPSKYGVHSEEYVPIRTVVDIRFPEKINTFASEHISQFMRKTSRLRSKKTTDLSRTCIIFDTYKNTTAFRFITEILRFESVCDMMPYRYEGLGFSSQQIFLYCIICFICYFIFFYEVHQEVHCLAKDGSFRRVDIIAIDRGNDTAIIIDPALRFETTVEQSKVVHKEKKTIYDPTTEYFRDY
ncbi:hypothetical protein ANN_11721 [Periplaneta americana]|uniref:Uncharacterized protein n=1 Tax=Periplaneta americana TaxID=6978 RepID=A0ABQ8T6X9_PERAM|nr:hypothetical protein ANN_11721 [Periplaneta americana]